MNAPASRRQKSFDRWAIETVGSPLDRQMLQLRGNPETGMTTLYRTRLAARAALSKYKSDNEWAFTGGWACLQGGNRIYQSARVVKVKVSVEPAT